MTATATSVSAPRGKARGRPALKLWHRWFGLLTGLWLLLLAVTGSIITFYDAIDMALNPDLRSVPVEARGPVVTDRPIGRAVARAEAEIEGFTATMIDLPDRPNESLWLIGRVVRDHGAVSTQAFVDPRDGTVLGWRESGKLALDRRYLMDIVYGLHVDLLIAPWVTWAFGLISLLWVVDHVVSVVLAIPRARLWIDAFRIKGQPGGLRHLFDLHRAPGMWFWPVTVVLAVTGVTLAWPDDSREVVRLVSPVSERLDFELPDVAPVAHPIGIDRAIALGPPGGVDSVRPLPDKGVYAVRTFDPRDVDDQGRLWTYVAMADGRIVGQRHDVGDSAGDTFFAWQYALHSGQAFGLVGRWLVFVGGVVTAMLCVTGVMLWARRRPR